MIEPSLATARADVTVARPGNAVKVMTCRRGWTGPSRYVAAGPLGPGLFAGPTKFKAWRAQERMAARRAMTSSIFAGLNTLARLWWLPCM